MADYNPKIPLRADDGKNAQCGDEHAPGKPPSICPCQATGTVWYGEKGWLDTDGNINNALIKERPADASGETECSAALFGAIDGTPVERVCWCKQPNYDD